MKERKQLSKRDIQARLFNPFFLFNKKYIYRRPPFKNESQTNTSKRKSQKNLCCRVIFYFTTLKLLVLWKSDLNRRCTIQLFTEIDSLTETFSSPPLMVRLWALLYGKRFHSLKLRRSLLSALTVWICPRHQLRCRALNGCQPVRPASLQCPGISGSVSYGERMWHGNVLSHLLFSVIRSD